MYMMTPMAQQSTGLPYRCRATTSGAERKEKHSQEDKQRTNLGTQYHIQQSYVGTQILRRSTGFSDGAVLKPGKIEITKDYFLVVIFCIVHQILQLKNT